MLIGTAGSHTGGKCGKVRVSFHNKVIIFCLSSPGPESLRKRSNANISGQKQRKKKKTSMLLESNSKDRQTDNPRAATGQRKHKDHLVGLHTDVF